MINEPHIALIRYDLKATNDARSRQSEAHVHVADNGWHTTCLRHCAGTSGCICCTNKHTNRCTDNLTNYCAKCRPDIDPDRSTISASDTISVGEPNLYTKYKPNRSAVGASDTVSDGRSIYKPDKSTISSSDGVTNGTNGRSNCNSHCNSIGEPNVHAKCKPN